VGNARLRISPPDAKHPLAEDRRVDQGLTPEYVREAGLLLEQLA
jgi:hypothetical protein